MCWPGRGCTLWVLAGFIANEQLRNLRSVFTVFKQSCSFSFDSMLRFPYIMLSCLLISFWLHFCHFWTVLYFLCSFFQRLYWHAHFFSPIFHLLAIVFLPYFNLSQMLSQFLSGYVKMCMRLDDFDLMLAWVCMYTVLYSLFSVNNLVKTHLYCVPHINETGA